MPPDRVRIGCSSGSNGASDCTKSGGNPPSGCFSRARASSDMVISAR